MKLVLLCVMNYKKCYQISTIIGYLQPETHTSPFITVCDSSEFVYQR